MQAAADQRSPETPVSPSPPLARTVRRGETFAMVSQDMFGDARAAGLLQQLNPGLVSKNGKLSEGRRLRLPSHAEVGRWLDKRQLGLGHAVGARSGPHPVPRWRAFSAPTSPQRSARDPMAELLGSELFHARLSGLGELAPKELGRAVWDLLAAFDAGAAGHLLSATAAESVRQQFPDPALLEALALAAQGRTHRVATWVCRELVQRLGTAIAAYRGRPDRVARLLMALARQPQTRRAVLLRLFGVGQADAAVASKALDRVESVEASLSGLPPASSARAQAIVTKLGLQALQQRLLQTLPMLASAVRLAGKAIGGGDHTGYLVSRLDFVRIRARRALRIEGNNSLSSQALSRLSSTEQTCRSAAVRAVAKLASELGQDLLAAPMANLECGLEPVLCHQDRSASRSGLLRASDVMVQARVAASSLRAAMRDCEAEVLTRSAAALARGPLFRDLFASAAPVVWRRAQLRQRFAAALTDGAVYAPGGSSAGDFTRDLEIFLDCASTLRDLYPDLDRRLRVIGNLLQPDRGSAAAAAERCWRLRPLVGRRRLSSAGLALVAAAWLIEHARELDGEGSWADRLESALSGLGGQVMQGCEQRLTTLLGEASL